MTQEKERGPFPELLHEFIIRGRREGYAGDGKPVPSLVEGTTQFEYREGEYLYRDIFATGDSNFGGQEMVYRGDEPIWTMVYFGALSQRGLSEFGERGRRPKDSPPSEEDIYNFLKKVLRENANLARFGGVGTLIANHGNWTYLDEAEHDFDGSVGFGGKEAIKFKGVPVYHLLYQGGALSSGWAMFGRL